MERAAPDRPPAARGSAARRLAAWLLGPATTALLGAGITAFAISRSWWVGAAVLGVATVAMTALEAWGRRVGGDGPEWLPLRWAYLGAVAVASAIYAAATGDEFYRVVLPALLFLPAVIEAGRGIRARRPHRSG
jgi:hypothetical protein